MRKGYFYSRTFFFAIRKKVRDSHRFIMLTKRQIKRSKFFVFLAVVSFVFQLGAPHLVFAAQQNYSAFERSQAAVFDINEIPVEKNEKLFAYSTLGSVSLPQENESRVINEHWLTVTAYSSEPRQTDRTPYTTGWITPVRDGVVAVNFLPLGSLVRFPDMFGDKVFVVEDRMNVRYKYRVDIWMPTREQAKEFGIKYLRMEVLGPRYPRDYVLKKFEPAFPGMK